MENWDDFRIFRAIADHGNLTAASRVLNLTQPTVGRRLSALEETLGSPLFHRLGRQWTLTELGQSLAADTELMAKAASAIKRHVAAHGNALSGSVIITSTEGFCTFWLPVRLGRLYRIYPDLKIEIRPGNRIADLTDQQSDLALRFSGPNDPAEVARPMGPLHYGLFAGRGYLERNGTPETVADLADHDFLGHSRRYAHMPDMAWLLSHAGEDQFILQSDSAIAHAVASRAGHGIACLPVYLARALGGLSPLLEHEEIPGRMLYLTAHRDLRHSARVDAVWNFLKQEMEADPDIG